MIDSSVFRTRAIQQRVEYMFSVFSCCTWLQPLMGKKMVMFTTQRCRISCDSIFLKAQDESEIVEDLHETFKTR